MCKCAICMLLPVSVMFYVCRIMVLHDRHIVEFDTPNQLLAAKGVFYGMAKNAGLA